MEEEKNYTVDVKVNEEYLENSNDNIFIRMKTLLKDNKADGLSFGSNHELVNKELHAALNLFQIWINQNLAYPEVITKLQELDRLQYGHNLACNEIGQAIARLYHQFITDQ